MTPIISHRVFQETVSRLLKRLDLIRIVPEKICILETSPLLWAGLTKQFPQAQIFSQAAQSFSFEEKSMDLIVANLFHYDFDNLDPVLETVHALLREDGLFLFSCYGPDTFLELRQALQRMQSKQTVTLFFDMHDIGDALFRVGFQDPVMDRELLNLQFSEFSRLLDYGQVENLCALDAPAENFFLDLEKAYAQKEASSFFDVSLEVIYGHAWKIERDKAISGTQHEFSIPIDKIQRIRK
jgi:SAM-dependent methyltransferase